ncbi:MAG: SH3 domain-containing protein, partial [Chloroflexota bacterium]|nr:SH3 domain-containing protein [Chloroflexota bacterium]
TSDGENLRGGPGADQPRVANVDTGTPVDLLTASADGAWWRVASDAGVGHISAAYLEPTGRPAREDVFDLDLSVPYSRQLSPVWCDPADVEMWQDYRQGSTGGPSRSVQAAIWDWEIAHNAGFSVDEWDCSPYAVASAAYHWMPGAGFDHFVYDDPLAGSRVLAWLLAHPAYREPSIALIWRGLHYVLVRGVRCMGNPAQDPNARLLGFYIADPDATASFWLGSDRFVPIDRWLGEMFTPVSYLTPHTGKPGDQWQDRMVAIQRSWSAAEPSSAGQRNASSASYT